MPCHMLHPPSATLPCSPAGAPVTSISGIAAMAPELYAASKRVGGVLAAMQGRGVGGVLAAEAISKLGSVEGGGRTSFGDQERCDSSLGERGGVRSGRGGMLATTPSRRQGDATQLAS